ncbi:MAG: CBS domain-containing protein [Pirellulales bacterium]|nr:CBS domain-containing protein [Pirellulales bacterium]
MQLRHILANKGHAVHSIRANASLDDVVKQLVQHNIGSLVVVDPAWPSRMQGIITERDILRALAHMHTPLHLLEVADCMTRDVIAGGLNDTVEEAMHLMTAHRVRHLPVVEGTELVGMISIGDLVKNQCEELTLENHYLKSYIHG